MGNSFCSLRWPVTYRITQQDSVCLVVSQRLVFAVVLVCLSSLHVPLFPNNLLGCVSVCRLLSPALSLGKIKAQSVRVQPSGAEEGLDQ